MKDRGSSRLCLSTEMFGKFEQGTRDPRIKGQKACGCQLFIGFAQAGSEYRDQIAIIVADAGGDCFTTEEARLAVPDRNRGGGAREAMGRSGKTLADLIHITDLHHGDLISLSRLLAERSRCAWRFSFLSARGALPV